MPPHGPLLKNDGPACRVCGCTQNNACVEPRRMPCHWVKVDDDPHTRLCSACAGTGADLAYMLERMNRMLDGKGPPRLKVDKAVEQGNAALQRWQARLEASQC